MITLGTRIRSLSPALTLFGLSSRSSYRSVYISIILFRFFSSAAGDCGAGMVLAVNPPLSGEQTAAAFKAKAQQVGGGAGESSSASSSASSTAATSGSSASSAASSVASSAASAASSANASATSPAPSASSTGNAGVRAVMTPGVALFAVAAAAFAL
jgi:hypothetical protein